MKVPKHRFISPGDKETIIQVPFDRAELISLLNALIRQIETGDRSAKTVKLAQKLNYYLTTKEKQL